MKKFLALILGLMLGCPGVAYSFESLELPPYDYVYEDINVLTSKTDTYITNNSREIAMLTDKKTILAVVDSLQNLTADEFAAELYDDWKLGKTTVLTVICPQEGKVGIKVGSDLMSDIPMNMVNNIKTKVLQDIAKKDFDKAAMTAHSEVAKILHPQDEGKLYIDYNYGEEKSKDQPLVTKPFQYTMYPEFDKWKVIYDQARFFSFDVRDHEDSILGAFDSGTGRIRVDLVTLKDSDMDINQYKTMLMQHWQRDGKRSILFVMVNKKTKILVSKDIRQYFPAEEINTLSKNADAYLAANDYDKALTTISDYIFEKSMELEPEFRKQLIIDLQNYYQERMKVTKNDKIADKAKDFFYQRIQRAVEINKRFMNHDFSGGTEIEQKIKAEEVIDRVGSETTQNYRAVKQAMDNYQTNKVNTAQFTTFISKIKQTAQSNLNDLNNLQYKTGLETKIDLLNRANTALAAACNSLTPQILQQKRTYKEVFVQTLVDNLAESDVIMGNTQSERILSYKDLIKLLLAKANDAQESKVLDLYGLVFSPDFSNKKFLAQARKVKTEIDQLDRDTKELLETYRIIPGIDEQGKEKSYSDYIQGIYAYIEYLKVMSDYALLAGGISSDEEIYDLRDYALEEHIAHEYTTDIIRHYDENWDAELQKIEGEYSD